MKRTSPQSPPNALSLVDPPEKALAKEGGSTMSVPCPIEVEELPDGRLWTLVHAWARPDRRPAALIAEAEADPWQALETAGVEWHVPGCCR